MIMYKRQTNQPIEDVNNGNEPPIENNEQPNNESSNTPQTESSSVQQQQPSMQQQGDIYGQQNAYNPYMQPPPTIPTDSNIMKTQKSNDKLGDTLKYIFLATGGLLLIVLIVTCFVLIIKRIKEKNEEETPEVYYRSESNHERSADKSSLKNSRSYVNSIEHIKYKNLNIPDDSINDIDIYSPSINSFSNFSLSQTAINSNGMNGSLLNPQVYDSLYDFKKQNPYNNNYYNDNKPKYSFTDVPYTNANYDPNPKFYFNKKDPLDDDEFIDGSL